jgi:H+/Cl- antiporter ClcA
MRSWVLALVYGCVAGAVTALTLAAMKWLEHWVWQGNDSAGYVAGVVLAGGVVIAALRHWVPQASVQEVVDGAHAGAVGAQRRWALAVALSAVVAVAMGGAVGPEAGLIAVVTELAAWVALVVGQQRRAELAELGVAASLSAWWGSPPAGAVAADERTDRLPRPLVWAAALSGLLGFALVGRHVLGGGFERLHLPVSPVTGHGAELLLAVVPAALGVLAGVLFAGLLPWCRAVLARVGGPVRQTLVGTAVFALLVAWWPVLRFSGHHELAHLPDWLLAHGPWALLALAVLKVLALCLCLSSGWLGGAIFPLLLAGGSAGLACVAWLPGVPADVAMAAGMAGAATVGLGKPVVAVLLLLFLAGSATLPAVCVGALLGYVASQRWPVRGLH